MNNDIAISVKKLSKRYYLQHPAPDEHGHQTNELWALKDVSFDIKKGESVGVIGPNGSGKSTLLKVLAGVTKPTSGSVEINGRVASILDIGAGFHPELSGRENVFLNGQLLGFREREINAKFDEIVAFSGIEKFIDEPVKNYSNGMYLRLAFSILVNLDFDVYLFDEVMNVGDVKFIIKSKDKIKQLAQNKKTVIYVSHNMKELENKDVYMRLEYGVLKGKTNLEKILDEFVYESIESMKDIHVHTHNVEITDFSSYPSSDKVKIHSVKFYQENIEETGAFCTNNPFVLEIDYEKLKHQNTIDVVVNIFDYNGISILSTAPFVKGDFSDEISPHRVNAKCIIPEYIFNTQIYFIKILFLEGLLKGMDTIKDVQIDRLHFEKKVTSIVLSLDNIFAFKTLFFSKNKSLDFSTLNLKGNLLAGFEWHSSIYME